MKNIIKSVLIFNILILSFSCFSIDNSESKKIKKIIYRLNPNLSPRFIDKKIKAIKTPFMFFRSFVNLYYYNIKERMLGIKETSDLPLYLSHGLVDYHIDNFNLVYQSKGSFLYTMNDPDNGAVVPLFTEFLRFLTGVDLYNRGLDAKIKKKMISNYLKGLRGDHIAVPKYIEKQIRKLKTRILGVNSSSIKKFRKIKKPRVATELNKIEKKLFFNKMISLFGDDINIIDQFKFLNITGGSGGFFRYRFIIKLKSKAISRIDVPLSKVQIIEFKEVGSNKNPLNQANEKSSIKDNYDLATFGNFRSNLFYNVYSIGSKKYLLRPRWSKTKVLATSKLTGDKFHQTIFYQANLIGLIQRHSLDDSSKIADYYDLAKKVGFDKWATAADYQSSVIKDQFEQLQD